MRTVGIIAEYNPFHNGHLYQINHIRQKLHADFVMIAMSGDYVQRGTPALISKHARADMALSCGADLVLELPVCHSCASAEFFAGGGVQLLDKTGVADTLCFGAETDNLPVLKEIAAVLEAEPVSYQSALKENLRAGMSFPAARSLALDSYFSAKEPQTDASGEEIRKILKEPNNILGIEYCRALLRENSTMIPYSLKRIGASFHETELLHGELPSATAIRKAVSRGTLPAPEQGLPAPSYSLLQRAFQENSLVFESDFDLLLQYCLLSQDISSLSQYADVSEHLARRIKNSLNQYEGFSQFVSLLKTKELTHSHIQRALLHILLQIREIPPAIPYLRVLGFRRESSALLREIKKRTSLPLITRMADAPSLLSNEWQLKILDQNTFASNLYESIVCKKAGRPFVHEYQKQIVIH